MDMLALLNDKALPFAELLERFRLRRYSDTRRCCP